MAAFILTPCLNSRSVRRRSSATAGVTPLSDSMSPENCTPLSSHITRPPRITYWSSMYLSVSEKGNCGSAISTAR